MSAGTEHVARAKNGARPHWASTGPGQPLDMERSAYS